MSEIEEVESLISTATFPGVKQCLAAYLDKLRKAEERAASKAAADAAAATMESVPVISHSSTSSVPKIPSVGTWTIVEDFAWEQGAYNTPNITIYVDIENVGTAKERVSCDFGRYSFDLKVTDLNGKNYRLLKDALEKDIDPSKCSFTVKKNKVVIKLCKIKGDYSYDQWNQLISKKGRDPTKEAEKKKDPSGGLMDMMKDMYEDGDENMKKIIGEAMMKSQRGEKADPSKMDMMDP